MAQDRKRQGRRYRNECQRPKAQTLNTDQSGVSEKTDRTARPARSQGKPSDLGIGRPARASRRPATEQRQQTASVRMRPYDTAPTRGGGGPLHTLSQAKVPRTCLLMQSPLSPEQLTLTPPDVGTLSACLCLACEVRPASADSFRTGQRVNAL